MSQLRVGVDLVRVAEVHASVERFGSRYLRRVYTAHEIASSEGPPSVTAAALAARFAAKEAAIKMLRPSDLRPDWRGIEVRRHAEGWCELAFHGEAARLAKDVGVESVAVSLSHEGDVATAVVVAWCAGP